MDMCFLHEYRLLDILWGLIDSLEEPRVPPSHGEIADHPELRVGQDGFLPFYVLHVFETWSKDELTRRTGLVKVVPLRP